MRRTVALFAAAALMVGLWPAPAQAAVTATLAVPCQPPSDSCWPAAFTFTPKGRFVFYLERYTGEIHRVNLATGADTQWGDVGDPDPEGERGALGIAVDPRWDRKAKTRKARRKRRRNRWVYVFYTHASPLENRVVRLRQLRNGQTVTERLLTITITTGSNHNAGVIHFGPDGMLYVVTGDQAVPARSQDAADPAGKVLRMTRAGGRPNDNPIPGSLAFSTGHRNSYGFGFDPVTGRLWQSENGPTCDDEVNLIIPGGNYGWGSSSACPGTSESGPSPIPPEHVYPGPLPAVTGVTFCQGCGVPELEGKVLLGSWNDQRIRALSLDAGRDDVTGEATSLQRADGVLSLVTRPSTHRVYFSDEHGIYVLRAA
jgi:glucose/arabinose dehydrogenase